MGPERRLHVTACSTLLGPADDAHVLREEKDDGTGPNG
jgi:hypothetical protein